MADLDWSKCEAVESIPGRVSGAWVFKDTRLPISVLFENLAAGANKLEVMEWFDMTEQQFDDVLEFILQSLQAAPHLKPFIKPDPSAPHPEWVRFIASDQEASELVDAHTT